MYLSENIMRKTNLEYYRNILHVYRIRGSHQLFFVIYKGINKGPENAFMGFRETLI